jgi:hypothetical protein
VAPFPASPGTGATGARSPFEMKTAVLLSRVAPAALALLLWNPWTFEWLIGTPNLYPAWARLAVCAPGLCVAALCIASALRPQGRLLTRLALAGATCALLVPLAGEGLIRLGIARGFDDLRDPGSYADPMGDDDYWKLAYAWNRTAQERVRADRELDPRIGRWNPGTRQKPAVVVRDEARDLPPGEDDPIFFFGDSFVGGVPSVPPELSLTAQLDRRLPGLAVYNYGVGGYGVDQAYLRCESALLKLKGTRRPIVLFGVLTVDLDRTIVSVRDFYPKPHFALEDGELVLGNVPLGDPVRWFEEHPPAVRSFFAAFVATKMRVAAAEGRWWESGYRRDHKMRVNRRILEEVVRLAREHDLPLMFVLFANENELSGGWRGPFLARVFDELGVPWVDTRDVIRASKQPAYGADRHFNAHGNALAAQVIAERVGRGLGGRTFEVRDPALYEMFVTPPDAVVCDPPASHETARMLDVLLVRAPSEMRFSVAPGEWLVRAGFGILPRGYRDADATRGVRFSVRARDPDGTERELWSTRLDPAARPEQRPLQQLVLPFAASQACELLLRTDADPQGGGANDLAFWTAVEIAPAEPGDAAR